MPQRWIVDFSNERFFIQMMVSWSSNLYQKTEKNVKKS